MIAWSLLIVILQHLLDYVRLDDRARANLVALHARLQPHFPAIAERFYDAVGRNPAAAFLRHRAG